MKRIPQQMAVATVLYYTPPTQHVIIIDRKNMYDKGSVVFDSEAKNIVDNKYSKYEKSAVRKLEISDNIITLYIETALEEY